MPRKVDGIEYEIKRNAKKNIILRVRPGKRVEVSAPKSVRADYIDDFVRSRMDFILAAFEREDSREKLPERQYSEAEAVEKIRACVVDCMMKMKGENLPVPRINIRAYKSMWGNCYHKRGLVNLNIHLLSVPYELMEYVVIHELCHFKHPDHSVDFWNLVEKYCPGCKAKRKELNEKYGYITRT